MEEGQKAIEQEIANLEQQLEKKKTALRESGRESLPEKELVREVVGEEIQQKAPSPSIGQKKPSDDSVSQCQPSYLSPELKDSVQALVDIVFSRGLKDAIATALKTKNPALLDAFHDAITDELYDEMVSRNKIEPVQ
jgi:hypothetical protein